MSSSPSSKAGHGLYYGVSNNTRVQNAEVALKEILEMLGQIISLNKGVQTEDRVSKSLYLSSIMIRQAPLCMAAYRLADSEH